MASTLSERVAAALGDKNARSPLDLVTRVRKGVPVLVLSRASANADMTIEAVATAVGIAKRTLARRKASGERLTPDESERAVRFIRVFERAADVVGRDRASAWLAEPNLALGSATPLSLLDTGIGAQEVEDVLGRLEHGVYT